MLLINWPPFCGEFIRESFSIALLPSSPGGFFKRKLVSAPKFQVCWATAALLISWHFVLYFLAHVVFAPPSTPYKLDLFGHFYGIKFFLVIIAMGDIEFPGGVGSRQGGTSPAGGGNGKYWAIFDKMGQLAKFDKIWQDLALFGTIW